MWADLSIFKFLDELFHAMAYRVVVTGNVFDEEVVSLRSVLAEGQLCKWHRISTENKNSLRL